MQLCRRTPHHSFGPDVAIGFKYSLRPALSSYTSGKMCAVRGFANHIYIVALGVGSSFWLCANLQGGLPIFRCRKETELHAPCLSLHANGTRCRHTDTGSTLPKIGVYTVVDGAGNEAAFGQGASCLGKKLVCILVMLVGRGNSVSSLSQRECRGILLLRCYMQQILASRVTREPPQLDIPKPFRDIV